MKVAVLGCGPAGLMALHGAVQALGSELEAVIVFSKKRKSQMFGAQYLHKPIPGATPEPDARMIQYKLLGDSVDYKTKVYGPRWNGTVSPEDYHEPHLGWDIRATYDWLWNEYERAVVHAEITPRFMQKVVHGGWDVVINTVPRSELCHAGHAFNYTTITAAGDAPEIGVNIGRLFTCPDETVICNGLDNPSWYRMSRVFGRTTVEWPEEVGRVPVSTASRVRKPTRTDCNCWPGVVHAGRYGTWRKGVLSHEAYDTAYNLLRSKKVSNAAAEEAAR